MTDAPGSRSIRLVKADRGAVPAFPPVRFPGPLPEPDVRLPPHPALHERDDQRVALIGVVGWVHGFGIFVPRYRVTGTDAGLKSQIPPSWGTSPAEVAR